MRRRHLPRSFEELRGLRCRGLIRESTVEQGAHSGPVVQLRDQVEFAARWGLQFGTRAVDGGEEPFTYTDLVSGSDAAKRPQFLQMVADAKAGQFDVLLVRDTSRFARNWRQAGGYEEQLHAAGVVIAYLMEQKLSSDEAAQLQIVVNHSINEDYRIKLSKNVQGGMRERFDRGMFTGSAPVGYLVEYEDVPVPGPKGWERRDTGRLILDERPQPRVGYGDTYTNADMARHIGELYATGQYGARSLAAHLNAEGYRNGRGELFTGNALRHLLSSPTYAGVLSWHHRKDKRDRGESGETKPGNWEPLWSEALWERIQAVRARQFKGSAGGRIQHAYAFRRIAVCDRCGRRLIGEVHRGKPYMVCSTQRERKDCAQKGVQCAELEDQLGAWLADLRIPEDWQQQLERLASDGRKPAAPAADRTAIEDQLRRLGDRYELGDITREEWITRRRALEAKLEARLEPADYKASVLARAKRLMDDWSELWRAATSAERAELVAAMFDEVRVRDKVLVHATPAREEYAALWATAEAARQRGVGLAPPDGLHHARPTLLIEGVSRLVDRLLAA